MVHTPILYYGKPILYLLRSLICCVAITLTLIPGWSQDLHVLHPVAWKTYGIAEGLPDPCVESAFVTREGRLVLIGCNYVRHAHRLDLYLFDGKRAYLSPFSETKELLGMHSYFEGIDESKRCYGYYFNWPGNPEWSDSITYFVVFDPGTGNAQIIPFGKGQKQEKLVYSVAAAQGEFFILTCNEAGDEFEIFSLKGDVLSSLHTFKGEKAHSISPYSRHFEVTPADFWIGGSMHELTRVSRSDGKVRTYPYPVSTTKSGIRNGVGELKVTPTGDILIASDQRQLYRWDSRTGKILLDTYLPEGWTKDDLNAIMLTNDQSGNLLIIYQKRDLSLAGILQDKDNRYYDYTEVLKVMGSQNHSLFVAGSSCTARDFKKEIFITGTLFMCIEVSEQHQIETISTIKGTRGIIELRDNELLIYPYGIYSRSLNTWRHLPAEEQCFVPGLEPDAIPDIHGNTWTFYHNTLCKYNIHQQSCQRFEFTRVINRIALTDDGKILLSTADNTLHWFDIRTQTFSDHELKQKWPGYVNQLYVTKNKTIWIATGHGLIHIDPQNKYQLIDAQSGLHASRILHIHEDEKGRLWLGTFMEGLHIYDPATQKSIVIDESKGLSHNTVVSILEDADHFIWVGTYDGITILAKDARILGHLYEQDGLVSNECNRWSQTILRDGSLCFGSIAGVSILSPKSIREHMLQRDAPKIYLTSIVHDGATEEMNVIASDTGNTLASTITLSASNRNLQLGFALSNYAAPDKNTFAYKILGVDPDWHYLGAQNEVTLSRLPAGNYSIQVIGADHRGQWTPVPVTIPIYAKEFFYRRWWFYMLCGIPFLLMAAIWYSRQRLENKRLEQEVSKRTETIQQQSDELREMDRMKSQLYTNITHEFRTPLTVIDGMVDHLHDNKNAPELIKRNTRNLLHLVNQMLDLRKLESGNLSLQWVQSDAIKFIRYITESFRSLAATKNIRFHFLTDVPVLMMDIDPEKLRQVLANLLSNAIKFTPEGGDVYVQLSEDTTQLMIKVSDTGIGIPEDKIQHIFKRFYQGDHAASQSGQGTGIGLTLASELVHMMKGKISVSSEVNRGTNMVVTLPIQRNAQPEESPEKYTYAINHVISPAVTTDPGVLADNDSDEGYPVVLIVEDNPDVVEYLLTALKSTYKVLVANDGAAGIQRAIEVIPDAIVSDVMMPVKDGFELCEVLKHTESTSHIPIILLTAKADVESRIAGLKRGADAYLSKPFHEEELLVSISSLIALRKQLQLRYQHLDMQAPVEDLAVQVEDAFVLRFREVIEKDLDNEDLDITQIATALHLSRAQLHRKITALTGKSATAFVRTVRLEASKKFLADASMNIAQVAFSSGFKYAENYSRAFSEEYGVSPSQWREGKKLSNA